MRGKGALVALLASPSAGYAPAQPRPRARRRPTQLEATTLDAKAGKERLSISASKNQPGALTSTRLYRPSIRVLDEQEHDDLPGRTHVINLAKARLA